MDTGKEPYAPLVSAGLAQVVGFEPDEAACEALNARGGTDRRYFPFFIGSGKPGTFYECAAAMTSSLFEPDVGVLRPFQNLENLVTTVQTHAVETHRLDDLSELGLVDYFKIDVQGGELDVFKGAQRVLSSVGVIHTEVEFIPLYKGQPLFADIDAHLRSQGFLFHMFDGLSGRAFKPFVGRGNSLNLPVNQILWTDAIYVRDFRSFDSLTPDTLLKIAIALDVVYQSFDLAHVALEAYDRKEQTQVAPAYLLTHRTAT